MSSSASSSSSSSSASSQPPNLSKSKTSIFSGGKRSRIMPKVSSGSGFPLKSSEQGSLTTIVTVKSLCQNPHDFLKSRGYIVEGLIGEGGFSKIYRARRPRSDNPQAYHDLAIKVFDLSDRAKQQWINKCLKNEMFVAKYLKHPNIVLGYEVLKTRRNAYIVMKYAERGSIKQLMMTTAQSDKIAPLDEPRAKTYFHGLLTGLQYMHHENIAHRDLKLDNFLVSAADVPMIADFGFAARVKLPPGTVLNRIMRKTPCGSHGYMAPELLSLGKPAKNKTPSATAISRTPSPSSGSSSSDPNLYDAKAADMFAMGIALFEMLNGERPFSNLLNEAAAIAEIERQSFAYRDHPCTLPNACKQLIESLLRPRPEDRLTADGAIEHRWIVHGSLWNTIADKCGGS